MMRNCKTSNLLTPLKPSTHVIKPIRSLQTHLVPTLPTVNATFHLKPTQNICFSRFLSSKSFPNFSLRNSSQKLVQPTNFVANAFSSSAAAQPLKDEKTGEDEFEDAEVVPKVRSASEKVRKFVEKREKVPRNGEKIKEQQFVKANKIEEIEESNEVGDNVESLKDVETEANVESVKSFEDFGVHPTIAANLRAAGITKFFPVQSQTYNDSKSGEDLIVRSITGSGKTLAFGLPLLQKILEHKKSEAREERIGRPLGIVMAPTRELAIQVLTELQKYAPQVNGTVIYGGVPYNDQIRAIHNRTRPIDYVVGTPGRVNDMINNGKLNLSEVKVTVLDEADEMLKIGFKEELDAIFASMPPLEQRQNLMFSATFDKQIQQIAKQYMRQFKMINLVKDADEKIPAEIQMFSMVSTYHSRRDVLATILNLSCKGNEGTRALVFANSKLLCDELAHCEEISKSGVNCVSLHGDMSQKAREQALQGFRDNVVKCIIATDVAARGLDIPKVDLVVHFGLPDKIESFVHRTGRTGRAGRQGVNLVLHDNRDEGTLRELEKLTNRTFIRKMQPKKSAIVEQRLPEIYDNIMRLSKKPMQLHPFMATAMKLVEEKLMTGRTSPNVDEPSESADETTVTQEIKMDSLLRGEDRERLSQIIAATLCYSTGYEGSMNRSGLTGRDNCVTLFVENDSKNLLKLPEKNASRKGKLRVTRENVFAAKDALKLIIGRAVENKTKQATAQRDPIQHLEICEDFSGCVFDVSPDIAEKLLSYSSKSSKAPKIRELVDDIPPLALNESDTGPSRLGQGNRQSGGRRSSSFSADRRGSSFSADRRGNSFSDNRRGNSFGGDKRTSRFSDRRERVGNRDRSFDELGAHRGRDRGRESGPDDGFRDSRNSDRGDRNTKRQRY